MRGTSHRLLLTLSKKSKSPSATFSCIVRFRKYTSLCPSCLIPNDGGYIFFFISFHCCHPFIVWLSSFYCLHFLSVPQSTHPFMSARPGIKSHGFNQCCQALVKSLFRQYVPRLAPFSFFLCPKPSFSFSLTFVELLS